MLRVISGSAKGRPLKAVPGMSTRPTTDKVKEALFSIIGPFFDGGTALDLFAGTGGLGIEALSRGLDKAVFIDADRKSVETVTANLHAARLADKAEVYRNDAFRALKTMEKRGLQFDLVFLDPPYKQQVVAELIQALQERELLRPGALIVAEYDSGVDYPDAIGQASCVRRADYGETSVSVYKWIAG